MCKISVIVPVYKAEKYIESCVKSILAQTYGDFELILVEDGSPDRSGELCDTLAETDTRIRVIHKENGGAATARNAGLDVAKGDYIAFIDGDDCVHPKYLEFLLAVQKETNADFVMCHYDFFTEEGDWFNSEPQMDYELLNGAQLLADFHAHCRKVSLISLCMKLFKKEVFEGLRIPEGQTAEDSLVLPLILECTGLIARLECKLYHWRQTPGSVTRGGVNTNFFHRINISDFYVRFFTKRGDRRQADHFKREFLQRTLCHYYRVTREKPELLPDFQPYLTQYRRRFWNYWWTKGMCVRERVAYAMFLVAPSMAQKFYKQVHGEGRP